MLARRLADAATLPLSDRPAPFRERPAAPGSRRCGGAPRRLVDRVHLGRPRRPRPAGTPSPLTLRIADDASVDSPYDGEGVPTRRVVLFERRGVDRRTRGPALRQTLGSPVTGHGVRTSFRTAPARLAPTPLLRGRGDLRYVRAAGRRPAGPLRGRPDGAGAGGRRSRPLRVGVHGILRRRRKSPGRGRRRPLAREALGSAPPRHGRGGRHAVLRASLPGRARPRCWWSGRASSSCQFRSVVSCQFGN